MLQEYHSNSHKTYICSDFNIDFLKVNEVQINVDYFDGILSAGYIPTIALPPRISDSSSLIDNIYTDSLSVEMSACTLNNHISDHQRVVLFCNIDVPMHKHKYITIRCKSDEAKAMFRSTFKNKHVRMLMHWYTKQELCIRWGAEMPPYFTISNGVRQGGILSPSLFTVYMVSSLLNTSRIGVHIDDVCINHVFYADDLCLMAPCAIALQELINVCYQYSKEVDLNFNATKSFCVVFTPKHYKLLLPSLFMNSLPILYADSIKYLGFIFTSNNCDDSDILKQMRMLYCRSNRLVRLFNKCSKPYCLNYVGVSAQYFTVLISGHNNKKTTFSKIRVAYNNVYRKILGVSRRASASGMFVSHDIPNFEAFLRKSIYSFTTRLSSSSNKLICAIEQSWIMKSLVWKTWEEKMYI